jgi:hypothetical protein
MTTLAAILLLGSMIFAQEPKLSVGKDDTIRSVLSKYAGKRVTVKLDCGEELSGVVRSVGDNVVHLEELGGKEFYDAVVDLDEIAAVIVRARGA